MAAPAAVNDLRVTARTETTLTLAWTAVGDEGYVGTAGSYALYWSEQPLEVVDEFNLQYPTENSSLPAPQVSGSAESYTLTGLVPGRRCSLCLAVIDTSGLEVSYSNVVNDHTVPGVRSMRTAAEYRAIWLAGAAHAFQDIVADGARVLTPAPGKRIIINSIAVAVPTQNKVKVSSPGARSCFVWARPAGGGQSRYWQGWPWFVADVDQPVTIERFSGSGTYVDVAVGYTEV